MPALRMEVMALVYVLWNVESETLLSPDSLAMLSSIHFSWFLITATTDGCVHQVTVPGTPPMLPVASWSSGIGIILFASALVNSVSRPVAFPVSAKTIRMALEPKLAIAG